MRNALAISFFVKESDFLKSKHCFFNEKIVNYGKIPTENFYL